MQSSSEDGSPVTGINVTPLVDVCLVLVIIFMVTAPIMNQPGLSVTVPKAKTKEGEEKANVTITITKDNKWAINETEVTFEDLPAQLPAFIKKNHDGLVVIRADQEALHGDLMEAMRIAKEAGAKAVTIATEQKR